MYLLGMTRECSFIRTQMNIILVICVNYLPHGELDCPGIQRSPKFCPVCLMVCEHWATHDRTTLLCGFFIAPMHASPSALSALLWHPYWCMGSFSASSNIVLPHSINGNEFQQVWFCCLRSGDAASLLCLWWSSWCPLCFSCCPCCKCTLNNLGVLRMPWG